ncbi:hypothetical protein BMF94_5668 [Rhodotorula taiwanensis]|uniref:Uncharacterized protein n=1 Tax=Rhodotorula taiwanensis TaxID=741276 RepID=A0A2S5B3M5_9BASI|nr:hypothetical protein BMF94_5668 [Rhodotorula taiwanensis]
MLAGAIAALFTGYYDLVFVPVAVPELLVRAMLPAEWGNADDAFLSADELQQATQVHLPDPGQGKRWVCVEAGKQVDTGVNYVPMGKSSFFEAKVEIPFLRHPLVKSTVPFTFKTVMLFSSRLMSFSSNHLTGLRSHHVVCIRTDNSYEAMDWIEIKNEGEVVVPEGQRWTEDLARRVLEGWWVGEHTGQSATKFIATSVEDAKPRSQLRVRLNLPALTSLTPERIKELAGTQAEIEENGWGAFDAAGFDLSESTKMQIASLSSL